MDNNNNDIMRTPFVGGNWKCNGSPELYERITSFLTSDAISSLHSQYSSLDICIIPSFIHLYSCQQLYENDDIIVCSQCIHDVEGYGAYTGSVSATMLRDNGIMWTLVGHSERRQGVGAAGHGESDELLASLTYRALSNGLNVIFCIGESFDDRQANEQNNVLSNQLNALYTFLLSKTDENNSIESWFERIVIAYEPVWAIGTGLSATAEIAQDTHAFIRSWINDNIGSSTSSTIRIIYGGSVKPKNANELYSSSPDVDGFLIGGCSLKDDFIQIIHNMF